MSQRTLIVAGTLTALAASALTVGAQAQIGTVTRPAARAVVQSMQARSLLASGLPDRSVRAAWLAAGRGDPGPTGSASATTAATALSAGSLLLPAGDMNHDGVNEVLDARYQSVGTDSERLVVFCRNGATGAVRWRKVIDAKSGHVYIPGPQLIGPKGLPGVVLVDAGTTESNKTLTVSLGLVTYDASGAKFSSHHESGTLDETTNAEQHVPVIVGLDAFQSKAEDWLIGRYSSPGGDNAPVTAAAIRIRGTDGASVPVGAAVTSPTGVPNIVNVPDLSGDSLSDVVVVVPGTGDGTGVFARRGSDGSDIWTNNSLTLNPAATAISAGDVHASTSGAPEVADIAVSTGTPTGGGLGLPLPIPDPTAPSDHGQVALLDGASGSPVWAQPKDGDFAYPVLLAGQPLKPATGVVTTDTTSDSSTTTATTSLVTYDDSGNQVYSVSWKATTKTDASGDQVTVAVVTPSGDFDGDGSSDGLSLIAVSSGNNDGSFTTLFHGADGSHLKSGAADPLGASTTGHGDDLALVRSHRGLTVTVHKGSDYSVLFSRKVPHTGGTLAGAAFGAPMHDKSSCADVLVAGQGQHRSIAALLTAKGAQQWVVQFKPGAKGPGTVFRPTSAPRIPTCGGPSA
jgi:hypothetical protein